MKCIEIGTIAAYDGTLTGLVIQATPEEIRSIAGNILYCDVNVVPADGERNSEPVKPDFDYQKRFAEQIERCGEIVIRLNKDRRKKYSASEVEAIIDELLDGIKPKGE